MSKRTRLQEKGQKSMSKDFETKYYSNTGEAGVSRGQGWVDLQVG